MKCTSTIGKAALTLAFWAQIELAGAVDFEPMNKALVNLLGTTKVVKKTVGKSEAYYVKGAKGIPSKIAFIERGVYEPNCTHTWAIGLDPKSGAVTEIRVIEMSCPHAFPTRAASFLDQYKGKGPADAAKLSADIKTIAKATGSSNLTTDAVKRTVTAYKGLKGKL